MKPTLSVNKIRFKGIQKVRAQLRVSSNFLTVPRICKSSRTPRLCWYGNGFVTKLHRRIKPLTFKVFGSQDRYKQILDDMSVVLGPCMANVINEYLV